MIPLPVSTCDSPLPALDPDSWRAKIIGPGRELIGGRDALLHSRARRMGPCEVFWYQCVPWPGVQCILWTRVRCVLWARVLCGLWARVACIRWGRVQCVPWANRWRGLVCRNRAGCPVLSDANLRGRSRGGKSPMGLALLCGRRGAHRVDFRTKWFCLQSCRPGKPTFTHTLKCRG